MNIKKFVRDRDAAFIAFVMNDDTAAVKRYCVKYKVPMTKKEEVFAAGIYKAVQECTSIPAEVKAVAADKCKSLGFRPKMWQ